MEIKVSEEIKKACPQFAGIAIRATVENTAYSESLWKKIDEFTIRYREMYTTDSIKDMVTIHATREAYKKCGKDPSRYRPSGEALCRRILRGISLYQIDTLVDLINLVSIRYGYSIGGFDEDKIQGDTLVLGIGKSGEPYEGIGRGELNIEGMPVYRDAMGTQISCKTLLPGHTELTIHLASHLRGNAKSSPVLIGYINRFNKIMSRCTEKIFHRTVYRTHFFHRSRCSHLIPFFQCFAML